MVGNKQPEPQHWIPQDSKLTGSLRDSAEFLTGARSRWRDFHSQILSNIGGDSYYGHKLRSSPSETVAVTAAYWSLAVGVGVRADGNDRGLAYLRHLTVSFVSDVTCESCELCSLNVWVLDNVARHSQNKWIIFTKQTDYDIASMMIPGWLLTANSNWMSAFLRFLAVG